ncbi:hypothetical protein [Veillonella sp.]|uniref:hypothetical protein n=1 Tax=Veillonella sp. TaxID=1926307 RepID=UPI0025F3592D|nr:hypothetical protein [Veillonella sp.]
MTNIELQEFMLKTINVLYRKDPWIKQLYQMAGVSLGDIATTIIEVFNNNYFDVASEQAIKTYEKDLNIKAKGTLEDRRKIVEMLWKNNDKCDIEKIRRIVKTYVLDDVDVDFLDGVLKVDFNNSSFVYALPEIKKNLKVAKPAHISMVISDVHEVEGGLSAGLFFKRSGIVEIGANVGFDTNIGDSNIYVGIHVERLNVVNIIGC